MRRSAVGAAAPAVLRIVQAVAGKSLVVALPLPPGLGAPQQPSPSKTFTIAAAMPKYDRTFWKRFSYSPILLKISTILRGLGLRQLNTGPGRTQFQYNNVSQLADAVAEVVKSLPATLEELLNVAADYEYTPLQEAIARLLDRFGDEIWGAGKERNWLLQASEGNEEYQKDLAFENDADRVVLMYHLRLWILVKAFNALRNKVHPRAKMPSQASIDGQTRKTTSGRVSKPSLPPQATQSRTHDDAFAATADLVRVSPAKDTLPRVVKERTDLLVTGNLQVRRTARTPKPRKDIDATKYTSDTSSEERLQADFDSADDAPRHYKGKRRAWKKAEIDDDPAFDVGTSTAKLRAKAPLGESTSRSKVMLTGSKSENVLPEKSVLNESYDEDATIRTDRGERRSQRPGKEALPMLTQPSLPAQEPKGKRRPRRKYLSEEVIRNSSNDSEEDNILTRTSTLEGVESAIGTQTRHLASQSTPDHHSGEHLTVTGPETGSQRSLSGSNPPVKGAPARQPPGACKSCKQRHQRCDRAHPTCGICARLKVPCEYPHLSDSTTPLRPARTPSAQDQAERLGKPITEDTNDDHNPQGGLVTDSTMPFAKRGFPLDEYWDKDTWRCFYLSFHERRIMLATMRSLGLKVTPRHRHHFRFDIENFVALGKDINKIASKLCSKFSAVQLVRYAEDPDYLDEEIDSLFEAHSSIWSLDADRTKLLAPGVDENYPKDLFYEESKDQKVLWMQLHRWIFLIALKNCKQMHGPGVSNMNKVPQLEDAEVPEHMLGEFQLDSIYMFEPPEESSSPASHPGSDGSASTTVDDTVTGPILGDGMFTDPTLEDYERDLFEALGQYFAEKKGQRNEHHDSGTLRAAEPDPAPKPSSRRRRKRKDSGTAEPEQQDVFRPLKQRRTDQQRMTSKGHDFSALFMSYLENYTDPAFDELAALKNLARELSLLEDHATSFHTKNGIEFATAFFVVSFPAWLLYRQDIVNAKRKFASLQASEQDLHRHVAVMERSRLATQLRQAHQKFMEAGHAGLRPEQVIYRALITLQNEHGHSQTAEDIRTGFQGMEHALEMLGDQLVKDGAKWILGDFASVASLKGMRPHAWVGQDARRLTRGLAGMGGLYA